MGHRIGRVQAPGEETQGVNDRWQLALAERELRSRTNRRWLLNGVTMLDPAPDVHRRHRRASAATSRCTRARSSQGNTVDRRRLRDRPRHPPRRLRGRARTAASSTPSALEAEVGDRARVGPYCHLPAGSHVAEGDADRRVLHCPDGLATGAGRRMEKVTTKKLALYSGRTHPELADEVAEHLGIELGHPNIVEFANGEVRPRFAESVRGNDVFILQTHYGIDGRSVNDSIMEQLIMFDAAYRASAKRITAVMPVLRLRPPGPQGGGPRADHRPPGRRHVQGRRRQADDLDRPPRRPDPGLLRRARSTTSRRSRCSRATCASTARRR